MPSHQLKFVFKCWVADLAEERMTEPCLLANREKLYDYLSHTVCDPDAIQELQEYLANSFERFMITLEYLPQTEGRVLELGATPYFVTVLMQRFRPGYDLELANFFGEDRTDARIIHQCHVENTKYGEQHVLDFRQFNVERQPFPYASEYFDGILFCEILEHLTRDPVAALLECHRVLKPGGWLLVTTPNLARYENIAKLWSGQNPADQYSGYGPYGRHNREYTLSELGQLLKGVGFQLERIEARPIRLPVQESLTLSMIRRLRPASRHEEHLFCLARRDGGADRTRPAWLYRSLPQQAGEASEVTDRVDEPESKFLSASPTASRGDSSPVGSYLPRSTRDLFVEDKGMRVSLINLNLEGTDAIGTCIINQARFFSRRGDEVRVYVLHPPHRVPADVEAATSIVTLGALVSGQEEHFTCSDLYIFHYPSRYDLMECIRGIDRGTVIFYYHNVTPPELWGSELDKELLIRATEGAALVHYADLCITPSPFNKQDLVERIGFDSDRVHVLPLAVSVDQFNPGTKDPALVQRYGIEGQRVLLFVGRMAGNKRIDLLVKALAQIRHQIPNTKLLLVGDDQSSPVYRQIVEDARACAEGLGIADDVRFAGRVDQLPPYFHLADVYVTASLHEGFGVPLIEAMASGVPVVASRSGAMPWVVDDAGLLFEPGSVTELANKVVQILQDDRLRQALVARGLERVQAFTLEQYEAALTEIVDKAMTYALPRATTPATANGSDEAQSPPSKDSGRDNAILGLLANEIEATSDIALRNYTVRSEIPLVGPVVAWLRRNLTSHLREPYLDPIIERQVTLNRQIAEWLTRSATISSARSRRQDELEIRVQALEAQIEALTQQSADENPTKEDSL